MEIKTVVVGPLEENCYLLEQDNQVLIVDPGSDAKKIMTVIGKKQVLGILITHHHFDHVGALDEIKAQYAVTVYDDQCEKGKYQVGPFSFTILPTPGHSIDSITFYFQKEKVMMIGDFVFYHSIGRTDLAGGNQNQMEQSISLLKQYPEETILYPGHGMFTTLKEEKQHNMFF